MEWVYHNLKNQYLSDEYLGCSQSFTITNNAAMTNLICLFMYCKYTYIHELNPGSRIARSDGMSICTLDSYFQITLTKAASA